MGFFLIALLAPVSLPAQTNGGDGETDPEILIAGKKVFTLNCANEFCHGPRGGGNFMGEANGQKLTDDIWLYGDGSYAYIVKTITEGLPGSPMEPWGTKLGAEKIKQVAAFVKQFSAPK